MATTPYMSLVLPVPGSGGTAGPTYAYYQNAAMTTIDAHDHTSGKGLPVPTAGLNINADVPFNSYNATTLRSVRLDNQSAALATASDLRCLYAVNGDLYYNNGGGYPVQITSGSGGAFSADNGFTGNYATAGASAYYDSAARSYTFYDQNANKAALVAGTITQSGSSTITHALTPSSGKALANTNNGTVAKWTNTTDSTDIATWTYSTSEMTLNGNIVANGGYKVVVSHFYVVTSNVAVTNQPVGSMANPNNSLQYRTPYAGYVRAITITEATGTNLASGLGSFTVNVYKNGASLVNATAALSGATSSTAYNATITRNSGAQFAQGDILTVVYTTSNWSQTLKYHICMVLEH